MQMLSEVISFSNRGHERKRFFPALHCSLLGALFAIAEPAIARLSERANGRLSLELAETSLRSRQPNPSGGANESIRGRG
jgi:hypothetical protein